MENDSAATSAATGASDRAFDGASDGAQVLAAWQVLAERGLVGIDWRGLEPAGWVHTDVLHLVTGGSRTRT